MRRVSDNYFNVTQILKLAEYPKTKRSAIVANEVSNWVHEKVQGGYGKYQGCWISMDLARVLAQRHGVETLLEPMLLFDPSSNFT